jgi:hypothetical protein
VSTVVPSRPALARRSCLRAVKITGRVRPLLGHPQVSSIAPLRPAEAAIARHVLSNKLIRQIGARFPTPRSYRDYHLRDDVALPGPECAPRFLTYLIISATAMRAEDGQPAVNP